MVLPKCQILFLFTKEFDSSAFLNCVAFFQQLVVFSSSWLYFLAAGCIFWIPNHSRQYGFQLMNDNCSSRLNTIFQTHQEVFCGFRLKVLTIFCLSQQNMTDILNSLQARNVFVESIYTKWQHSGVNFQPSRFVDSD